MSSMTNSYRVQILGLYCTTKALRLASQYRESVQSAFAIIEQCGEDLPRAKDEKVIKDTLIMNATLQKMTDEAILSIEYNIMDQRTIFLMKLYAELANMLHFVNPSLGSAVSLRLAELTLKNGLPPSSPLAFAHFASVVVNLGNEYIMDACRLCKCSHSQISFWTILISLIIIFRRVIVQSNHDSKISAEINRKRGFLYLQIKRHLSCIFSIVMGSRTFSGHCGCASTGPYGRGACRRLSLLKIEQFHGIIYELLCRREPNHREESNARFNM